MNAQPSPTPLPGQLIQQCPGDKIAGHHADFASIWHTPDTFVMDFLVYAQPPGVQPNPMTGQPISVVNSQLVTRVRIPQKQVFEIMKGLGEQLTLWERETGQSDAGPN